MDKVIKENRLLTEGLQKVRRVALASGGSGISEAARRKLWEATATLENEVLRGTGRVGPMRSAFPSADSFVRSLRDEQDRCLSSLGWRLTEINIGGKARYFYFRDALPEEVTALETASKVRLYGHKRYRRRTGRKRAKTRARSGTMENDLYWDAQEELQLIHGQRGRVFTMAIQRFSGAALVSHSSGKMTHERLPRCLVA